MFLVEEVLDRESRNVTKDLVQIICMKQQNAILDHVEEAHAALQSQLILGDLLSRTSLHYGEITCISTRHFEQEMCMSIKLDLEDTYINLIVESGESEFQLCGLSRPEAMLSLWQGFDI